MEKSVVDVPASPTDSTISKGSDSRVTSDANRDVEKSPQTREFESSQSAEADPYIVDWDGPDDPTKPINWPAMRKWKNLILVSILTLLT